MALSIFFAISLTATALTTGIPVENCKIGIAIVNGTGHIFHSIQVSSLRHICRSASVSGFSLLLLAGFISLTAHAETLGNPVVTTFTTASTGFDGAGWVATQDADGVLYFGSNSLVTFDGERWKQSPIGSSYALRGLDFGKDGRLWAAAVGEIGWFERKVDGAWQFHSLRSFLSKKDAELGEVWRAWAVDDGAVFVTAEKILHWNGKRFTVLSLPGARRLTSMRAAGKIFVHHGPTGLSVWENDGLRQVIAPSVLKDAVVLWMETTPDGSLLVTSKGLFTYGNGALTPFAPEASEIIRRSSLTCATRLSDGRLAIGTFLGGIIVLRSDGTVERVLDEQSGLPVRAIYSLSVDREGALWATSTAEVFRVAIASPSSIFDQRTGLAAQANRVITRHDGKVTVGNASGVFVLDEPSGRFRPERQLTQRFTDMQSTPDGLVLGGLYSIKRLKSGEVTELRHADHDVFLIRRSRVVAGALLVSEGRSILTLAGDGRARVVVKDLPDIVTSIAETEQGELWLGTTSRGVLVARPDPERPVEAMADERTLGLVGATDFGLVASGPDGSVLLLSSHGGWTLAPGAKAFVAIDKYPERGVSFCSDFAHDGSVWLAYSASDSAAAAVARVSVQGGRGVWQAHFVEGLESIGQLRSLFVDNSPGGQPVLWIGGTEGVLRHEVRNGPAAPHPRGPLLHAYVRTADHDALRPITGSVPYSTRAVTFEFAAPEFALRPSLRLETRIDGIDDRWVPADATARRELTAIRDGRYAFHVRAVASTGAVSETTSFGFTVTPPWWRTAPALAGAVLALIPFGYGTYRLRIRALRRRNAELEAKVSQRTEQLAQASAAKTQFVANMSHDIRNPLNGIVGLALALEDTRLDPKQRELVATLRECTTYLSTLVDDVLDFASIEAGRVELRPGPFVPAELLRSVVATLRADAEGRGATLMVTTDPDLPPSILGDAGRIQQILVNYVSNALKYAGGNIWLSATAPVDSPGEIEFAVTDEGAGIGEADQAALFTKFHRLSSAQASPIKGSGLGLASCRLLADLMGGSVGVQSHPGQGARFHLRLPLAVASAPAPVIDATVPNTSVLLVEDADYNAWAATAVLGRLGLTCERARTGAEAVRLFTEKRFNLVLLDRNLPDMDGTDVARQIRALEEDGPRAIVLAVTAYCTPQDRAVCLEAGMDAFVGKPLTPAKLRKILIAAGRRLLTAASMHVSPDATVAAGLDVSLLDYLSDGKEADLGDQIERFLAALAEGEARLAQAARARDFATLGVAAHFVLSQARLVGSVALEEAAIALERAAEARDAFAFGEIEQRVHREVRAVTATMRRRRPSAQTA